MKIPFVYNLRSIGQRPVSTAMTALGVSLVVAVFVAMLTLHRTGMQRLLLLREEVSGKERLDHQFDQHRPYPGEQS